MNKKEEARCQKMIDKIDACLLRKAQRPSLNTVIEFTTEWVITKKEKV